MILAHIWTEEQYQFLRDNAKGIGNKELTNMINKELNLNLTPEQIKGAKGRKKIDSGLDGRFVKGQEPWNKGKKDIWGPIEHPLKKGMSHLIICQ